MKELIKAFDSLKQNRSWESNGAGWTRLKESFDSLFCRFGKDNLETIVVAEPDLPKALGEIALFLALNWSSVIDHQLQDRIAVIIAYFRLVKAFDRQDPQTSLETAASEWVKRTLENLTGRRAAKEEDELLAIALVEADLAPDHWIAEVALPAFKTALRRTQSVMGLWSMPSVQLRKLLAWSCCLAISGEFRHELDPVVEALDSAKGALSSECFGLYVHLKEIMARSTRV